MTDDRPDLAYLVSWDEYVADVRTLVAQIKAAPRRFSSVFGVPRNGLVLAVSLSNALNIPLVTTPGSDTLVVDDITVTGAELHPFAERGNATAVLLHSPELSALTPTFFARTIRGEWPVFPWENVC